jgi:hypothetical protein
LDEIRKLKNKAEAVGRYLRAHGAAEESAVRAIVLTRRAERRLGELLRGVPKTQGARGKSGLPQEKAAPTLADMGVSWKDSHVWQSVASVPEKRFERELATHLESKTFPTRALFLRIARDLRNGTSEQEPVPFHPLVALGELKDRIVAVLEAKVADWTPVARQNIPGMLRDLADDLERRYQ